MQLAPFQKTEYQNNQHVITLNKKLCNHQQRYIAAKIGYYWLYQDYIQNLKHIPIYVVWIIVVFSIQIDGYILLYELY